MKISTNKLMCNNLSDINLYYEHLVVCFVTDYIRTQTRCSLHYKNQKEISHTTGICLFT